MRVSVALIHRLDELIVGNEVPANELELRLLKIVDGDTPLITDFEWYLVEAVLRWRQGYKAEAAREVNDSLTGPEEEFEETASFYAPGGPLEDAESYAIQVTADNSEPADWDPKEAMPPSYADTITKLRVLERMESLARHARDRFLSAYPRPPQALPAQAERRPWERYVEDYLWPENDSDEDLWSVWARTPLQLALSPR